MNMKNSRKKLIGYLLQYLFLLMFISAGSSAQSRIPLRQTLDLNSNWAFCQQDVPDAAATDFDDSSWEGVSIPHVMGITPKHNGGGKVYQGTGWYRRHFTAPVRWDGHRLYLSFEGVQMDCEIYLNGEKLGEHHGGYMGFGLDISGKVRFGKSNILAVKVSNLDNPHTPPGKKMLTLDFNYYGGIYRNVSLSITHPLHISDELEANKIAGGGIFILSKNVSREKAALLVNTQVVNAGSQATKTMLLTKLIDKSGRVVASAQQTIIINGKANTTFRQQLNIIKPFLWHPDHPYLYQLESVVYDGKMPIDKRITPTGIRTISFTSPDGKADGFYINGEKLYLRGANRHQVYPYVGDAAPASMQYRDALQLKKGGFNAVRAAHYPSSPDFLRACDELGLLVIECQPGWQYYSNDSTFKTRTFRDIRQMIRRDRNHPSVFLWETSLNESPTPASWMQEAVRIAHEEMPGDQMFTADDYNQRSRDHYDVFYKLVNPDMTDPAPGKPSLTREWGDTWVADAAKENGLRASRKYTARGLINQCILRQQALNGETSEEHGGYWDHARLDANPRIGGYFVWSYNDYTRGSDPVTAFSGVVDMDRYEKFSYYQLQSMQSARNKAYGPMIFIASYNNLPDMDSTIVVFSNCDTVMLYRNNKPVGMKTRSANAVTAPFVAAKGGSPLYAFPLGSYEPGILRAEGWLDGKLVCKHTISTPKTARQLEISIPEPTLQPVADGSDMIPVYIKVCDENNTIVTNTEAGQSYEIKLHVTGAGYLAGGNIPSAEIAVQHTEGGIGYALIKTADMPGDIRISAECKGLKGAVKIIKTRARTTQIVPDAPHSKWVRDYERTYSKSTAKTSQDSMQQEILLKDATIVINDLVNPPGAASLTDGNNFSGWTAPSDAFPLAITLHLGKTYSLTGNQVFWGKDSDWYTYRVETSADGVTWTVVSADKLSSGQDYKPVPFNRQHVQHVRYVITGIKPESSRVAVKEILLFGTPEH
ncbi:glycoside hydrolase family 2 TIM barrel-domain containing protein [Chitinophaga sp. 212800010-3]|uniref:glycoside hydrolase family 2 TIM barrel-domain containing protein n=1 Tax=unclassified Chitinophaga TaxID=2619133 RepID=UPI002DE7E804|nr:Beta-galactosidase [Chitinophaga sp. 212800010-3]